MVCVSIVGLAVSGPGCLESNGQAKEPLCGGTASAGLCGEGVGFTVTRICEPADGGDAPMLFVRLEDDGLPEPTQNPGADIDAVVISTGSGEFFATRVAAFAGAGDPERALGPPDAFPDFPDTATCDVSGDHFVSLDGSALVLEVAQPIPTDASVTVFEVSNCSYGTGFALEEYFEVSVGPTAEGPWTTVASGVGPQLEGTLPSGCPDDASVPVMESYNGSLDRVRRTDGYGFVTTWTWHRPGVMASETLFPQEPVWYQRKLYDNDGRLERDEIDGDGDGVADLGTTFQRDVRGNLTAAIEDNGSTEEYVNTYDSRGYLTRQERSRNGSLVDTTTYRRDAAGRAVETTRESWDSTAEDTYIETTWETYDPLGRRIRSEFGRTFGGPAMPETFETWTYNALGQVLETRTGNLDEGIEVVERRTVRTYDADGNMLSLTDFYGEEVTREQTWNYGDHCDRRSTSLTEPKTPPTETIGPVTFSFAYTCDDDVSPR